MHPYIQRHFFALVQRYPQWAQAETAFTQAVCLLQQCIHRGGKILVCGNGGSAADAEHIVGELMKGFLLPRPLPVSMQERICAQYPHEAPTLTRLQGAVAAVSLVSGVSLPTAFANDVHAELIFAQQVYGLAREGDVLWGISTSGNACNVNQALRVARVLHCRTLGLTGRDGGVMAGLLDVELRAPSQITPEIQELHLPMYHALCACLEEILFA